MQDLLSAAKAVLSRAYAPYSHYHVASALRAEDGQIFVGCNVENAAYPVTLCAEASALGALISSGQQKIIEALVLVDAAKPASPCGACRQRLSEMAASREMIVHMCTLSGTHQQYTIAELLPLAFDL